MQHQLGSSEGSISLQKDGEELHCETREPAAFSPAIGAGKDRKRESPGSGQHQGMLAVYMLRGCIQVSSVRLLITFGTFRDAVQQRGE